MNTPNKSGMTLLEVLMVTVLMFFIVYAVFGSIKSITKANESVQTKSAVLQEFRSAFGILERDLRSAYYSTAEDYGWFPRKEKPQGNPPPPPDPNEAQLPPPTKPTPITLFQGKENMLFFSTRTHQRLSANSPENEEHFVFYELKNNELHRSESKRAIRIEDRQNPEEFRSYVLIDKVVSVKFSFWNLKQQRWVTDWDSEKSEFLNRLPEAVKLEIKFTPEFATEKGSSARELFLISAVRLNEASYRNITWSSSSSTAANPPGGGQPGGSGE